MTAEMRDKLNIDCHPLFGGLGYLMLKNFAAYFIKTSILNKNSIKLDPVGSTVRYEMMKLCTGSV